MAVDKYCNCFNNNIENGGEMREHLIPNDAPRNIVYKLGSVTVNKFTIYMFYRLPTTGQDTVALLEIISSGLKWLSRIVLPGGSSSSGKVSNVLLFKIYWHWPLAEGTSLRDNNV